MIRNTRNRSNNTPENQKEKKTFLKVVSATFLLVCFVCLKERTCETTKNFKFSDIQMS